MRRHVRLVGGAGPRRRRRLVAGHRRMPSFTASTSCLMPCTACSGTGGVASSISRLPISASTPAMASSTMPDDHRRQPDRQHQGERGDRRSDQRGQPEQRDHASRAGKAGAGADPLALALQLGTGQLQLAAPQLGDLLGQPAHQLAGGGLLEIGSIATHLRLVDPPLVRRRHHVGHTERYPRSGPSTRSSAGEYRPRGVRGYRPGSQPVRSAGPVALHVLLVAQAEFGPRPGLQPGVVDLSRRRPGTVRSCRRRSAAARRGSAGALARSCGPSGPAPSRSRGRCRSRRGVGSPMPGPGPSRRRRCAPSRHARQLGELLGEHLLGAPAIHRSSRMPYSASSAWGRHPESSGMPRRRQPVPGGQQPMIAVRARIEGSPGTVRAPALPRRAARGR